MKLFIKNLPKDELHVHAEGTLAPEQIMRLAHGVTLPWTTRDEMRNGT